MALVTLGTLHFPLHLNFCALRDFLQPVACVSHFAAAKLKSDFLGLRPIPKFKFEANGDEY